MQKAGPIPRPPRKAARVLAPVLLAVGCAGEPLVQPAGEDPVLAAGACQLDPDFLFDSGVGRDGIPALSQPTLVSADDPALGEFLSSDDRVVGFTIDDVAYAVPHNILWYHEIVNVSLPSSGRVLDLAITYCPLTGSALVFDRAVVDGAELGVSGLLYKSNLIMYDRRSEPSLWPQMLAEARCGTARSTRLPRHPAIEMTWDGWRTLQATTRVVVNPGSHRGYDRYPYTDYEQRDGFAFPMPDIDPRRPPKERVLGIRDPAGGEIAFPFGSLQARGAWAAVSLTGGYGGEPAVLFWDESRSAAMAYLTQAGDQHLTFRADDTGIEDVETGSRWTVDGRAVSGPLAGSRLDPVPDAFVAFWGAWYSFFPATQLWGPAKP